MSSAKSAFIALSVVLLQASASADTPAGNPIAQQRTMSLHEWKKFREHARTSDDFRTLAKWCEDRASKYKKDQSDLESELKTYYARYPVLALPKYPPRDQTLKTLIARYAELETHWHALATHYNEQAQKLDTPASRP